MSTEYYYKNHEKYLLYQKKYRQEHKEYIREYNKQYKRKPLTREQKDKKSQNAKIKRQILVASDPKAKERFRILNAKSCGRHVFYCQKCGILTSSKDPNRKLCIHCGKKTPEERKAYLREKYLKNIEKIREYQREYRKIGKTEKICEKCKEHFWTSEKNRKICHKCLTLKTNRL